MPEKIMNISAAIEFIEENLAGKLNLETVARAVHYSKYHLHRAFTQTTGITLHGYIQRRRLTEAAKLLVFSKRPVIDLALTAGYESQQAFSLAFKEMYKKTPGQYRTQQVFYPLQLRCVLHRTPVKGRPVPEWTARIRPAVCGDLPKWMALARIAVDGFPNLQEDAYLEIVRRRIRLGQALILEDQDIAVGAMLFTPPTGSIDFLGIHPQYRRAGIAEAFLRRALCGLMQGSILSTTTFRRGDKADPGFRSLLESLGFAEAELLTEFGYPTQRMILHTLREERP